MFGRRFLVMTALAAGIVASMLAGGQWDSSSGNSAGVAKAVPPTFGRPGAGPTTMLATMPASVPAPTTKYADGLYTGSGRGFRGENSVTVEVKIEGGKIASILAKYSDDAPWFTRAFAIAHTIVEKQTMTGVSTVTGATYSSRGILSATKVALGKAASQPASGPASGPAESPMPVTTPPRRALNVYTGN